jgi:deoxyribodipyrimidine photo-lyase
MKFGTLSVREFHQAVKSNFGPDHPLIRQLYWRDFFTHIASHFDRVFGQPFHSEYEFLSWDENPEFLLRWKEGMTGFPIVDAGMRQLNETGFMHNRARMVCASFLVKDLHIDWREGERYFATKLEDYDPCVNNGNWQWVASTGCDAAPYFRIFNPWLQQKKYDPDANYILQWIPELRDVPAAEIHGLFQSREKPAGNYPEPVVDHAAESRRALELYRLVKDEKREKIKEE